MNVWNTFSWQSIQKLFRHFTRNQEMDGSVAGKVWEPLIDSSFSEELEQADLIV